MPDKYPPQFGDVIYEITGGLEPYIYEWRISEIISYGDTIELPDKRTGRQTFSINDFGIIVFTDYNSACDKLEIIRRRMH